MSHHVGRVDGMADALVYGVLGSRNEGKHTMSDKSVEGAKVVPVILKGEAFDKFVLRVWKGKLMGADDATIRAQSVSEGISEESISLALSKAKRSQFLAQDRLYG